MTLRRAAGLLAVSGLLVGLLGSGVGASFLDAVTGTENINVGSFQCIITGSTQGTVSGDNKSVTYTAPTITSSAPDSAPFDFTVKNDGTIPMALSVSGPVWGGNLDGSFSGIAPTVAPSAILAPGASATVSTGIQWTALDSNDLGDSGSATWTVSCSDYQVVTSSSMSFGSTGWGGWSCPSGTDVLAGSFSGSQPYILGLAKPGVTTDGATYPVYPHYTYTPPEEGVVVHNGATGQTGVITAYCTLP
jgi:hypothetical protein